MGGCAKNTGKDNSKDGKDGKEGTNRSGIGAFSFLGANASGFDVGPERKFFQISLFDKGDTPLDDVLLNDHLSHLDELTKNGLLDSANAYVSGNGGTLVLVASDEEEARKIVDADPLLVRGFYKSYSVEEVIQPS